MMLADAPFDGDLGRLMREYQEGNTGATTMLIAVLSPRLFRFFASRAVNRVEAEDMLQEAWLRIHRMRHTYRGGEPLLPWIYALARRVGIDGYRRRRRLAMREIAVDRLPEAGRLVPNHAQTLPTFAELISSLPASQREVVTLLKVSGLSLEDVARTTSSTVGAVKQKAHRAYSQLRIRLRDERLEATVPSPRLVDIGIK